MSDEYVDLPVSDEDDEEFMDDSEEEGGGGSSKKKAKQHVEQLKRLQQKASRYFRDPEFYKYLEQFDKDLLGFDDDDDEIELLGAPSFGGKKEAISELMLSKPWKRHGNLMRIYLANALHMITEMTDEQMIAFTIHRVRASAPMEAC
ncbi:unnamed protein product [Miscanthus lutarioriparius]|uniref:Uncharacterized protein n=1 Tax=Miscanthus lutarioriparius TaxID=422564 RepID=A0A811SB40_9POAL|nr:unnamed protein product [Miscanthus lutarioriparius]